MDFRKKALAKMRKPHMMEELPSTGVSVMADSEEGLEEGLDVAKKVVKEGLPELEEMDDEMEDEDESPESQAEEILEKLTPEVARILIEKLSSKL